MGVIFYRMNSIHTHDWKDNGVFCDVSGSESAIIDRSTFRCSWEANELNIRDHTPLY